MATHLHDDDVFPDMEAQIPAHLRELAPIIDGWVDFDGSHLAMGGPWLRDLLPPAQGAGAAGEDLARHLFEITHPEDRDLADPRWLETDQRYDQVVRLATRRGYRPYLFRTLIQGGHASGIILQIPLRRLIDEPLRRRMSVESALTRSLQRLLIDADADAWTVGSELLPRLARMLGAARAHLGEVTARGIRPVASHLEEGVPSAGHLEDAARAMADAAQRVAGIFELDPFDDDPAFADLTDVMRRRGVAQLLLITPDTRRGDAVMMAFELPPGGASARDASLVQAVVNVLNEILCRRAYAAAVQRATSLLARLAALSIADPPLAIAERIDAALCAVADEFGAVSAGIHPTDAEMITLRRTASPPAAFQAAITDLGIGSPALLRHAGKAAIAVRIPRGGVRSWGVLVVWDLAERTADVSRLELQVAGVVAAWLGSHLSRHQMFERLRGRERELAALSARREAMLEDERAHIARELHDALGQSLTAASLEIGLVRDRVREGDLSAAEVAAALGELMDVQGRSIGIIRAICSDLRPPMLEDAGLMAALEWEAERWRQRAGLVIDCTAEGAEPDGAMLVDLYRIGQEALCNVARHARARNIWVRLAGDGATITLTVSDDGVGMPLRQDDAIHLGIVGMRERAAAHGGTLAVTPRAGGGTTLTATLPRS